MVRMTWCFVACSILAVGGLLHARADVLETVHAQANVVDYTALSGVWKGNLSTRQRGDCTVAGRGRSDQQVELVFEVAADGSLRAGVIPPGAKRPRELAWEGHFSPDMRLTVERPMSAVCETQRGEYRLTFNGRLNDKKGVKELEFEADNPSCPEIDCVFKHVYTLKKK
jgi:hypothetical protein